MLQHQLLPSSHLPPPRPPFSQFSLQELIQDVNAGERLMEKAGGRGVCRQYPGRMS